MRFMSDDYIMCITSVPLEERVDSEMGRSSLEVSFIVSHNKGDNMFIDRKQEREHKLSKRPLIELEDELWQLNQLSKLNKDTRNRKARLEKVVAVKRFALQKVQEKIAREYEKSMSEKIPEVTGK